ncbi:hypothetical protein [Dyadobacter sp. 3J3]|uniref:hypothetical protein n=1 Tax=Dyadobacter sp. 3J3 TaxID=2606600 RepID=UPI00135A7568|nr:hypothetical protein [Dyadobacter sp. 3J3]
MLPTSKFFRKVPLRIISIFVYQPTYSQLISTENFGAKPDSYENITPRTHKIIDESVTRHSTKLVI